MLKKEENNVKNNYQNSKKYNGFQGRDKSLGGIFYRQDEPDVVGFQVVERKLIAFARMTYTKSDVADIIEYHRDNLPEDPSFHEYEARYSNTIWS